MASRYSPKISQPHGMPSCRAVPGMSSTASISATSSASVPGRTGAKPTPQLPITTVVTPCHDDGVTCLSQQTWPSKWVWMSTKPGVTSAPSASTVRRAVPVDVADGGDHAVADGDVGGPTGRPRPVDHEPVADVQIVHGASCGVAPDPTAPGRAATSLAAGPARARSPRRGTRRRPRRRRPRGGAQRAERRVPERTVEAAAVPRADVRVRLVGRRIAGGEADVDPDPAGQLDRDGEVEVLGPQRRRADGADRRRRGGPARWPRGRTSRRAHGRRRRRRRARHRARTAADRCRRQGCGDSSMPTNAAAVAQRRQRAPTRSPTTSSSPRTAIVVPSGSGGVPNPPGAASRPISPARARRAGAMTKQATRCQASRVATSGVVLSGPPGGRAGRAGRRPPSSTARRRRSPGCR